MRGGDRDGWRVHRPKSAADAPDGPGLGSGGGDADVLLKKVVMSGC